MKKILLFTESLGAGGTERQLCGLANMLSRNDYEVLVVTYCYDQFYEQYLIENNVKYEFHPEFLNRVLAGPRLAFFVKQRDIDIVISFLPMSNVRACIARLFAPFKLFVSERNTNMSTSLKDRFFFFLYKLSDSIIPNSKSQENYINTNFPSLTNRVTTITNFVDLKKFNNSYSPLIKGTFRVMIVGRILPQKNVLLFLDAVKLLKDDNVNIHFDWYGKLNAQENYSKEVVNKVESLNISDYISFHKLVKDIHNVYGNYNAFCLPSLFEGFPNVVCEAMACGLPVACSNVCDNSYIVEDGVTGYLFNPLDVEDIVKTLKRISSNTPDELKQKSMASRLKVENLCSEEVFLRKYVNMIENS